MNHTRKILIALLVLMTILVSLAAVTIPASAATTRTIYLKPSSNWLEANAWFQAWTWGGSSSDAWVTFTDSNYDGIYEATIPSDRTGMKILRKGPSQAANSWTSWAETGDISITSANNCVSNTGWSTSFSWSSISAPASDFTLTVAGAAGLTGAEWDTANTANDMTLVSGRVYEKTFTGIAAGTYEFKVLANHSWTYSWGDGSNNASVEVALGNSNVTVSFDEETKAITTKVEHVHTGGTATCTAKAECSVCGESYGELADHTLGAAANCTTAQTCTVCGGELNAALGHSWTAANCDTPKTCSACGATEGEALGHSYDNACDTTCNTCGVTREIQHNYNEGICSVCGAADPNYVPPVKITLSVPGGVDPVEMGADNLLPVAGAPDGFAFVGWSEVTVDETTTKPTILEAGTSYTGDSKVLYALYSYTQVIEGPESFQLTDFSEITDTDVVVITMTVSGKVYPLISSNGTSSAPTVTAIAVSNDTISGTVVADDMKWNIVKDGDSFIIYVNGSKDVWLYCKATNNGVRVGNNDDSGNNVFIIDADTGYLCNDKTSGDDRYLGVYNNQDWRCYTSVNSNIKNQTLGFYVLKSEKVSTTYYLTKSTVACDHSYESVVTEPTCTTAGYTTHTCTECGDTYTDSNVAAKGHSHVESITTPATCTTAGLKTFTCSCGDSYTEAIDALGHNFVNGVCDRDGCDEKEPSEVVFELGENGSASHYDGSKITSDTTFTSGDYKLVITPGSNVYSGARDLLGNSCIKLGTSSGVASFSFTVGDDVEYVIINVAGYKAKTVKITVNGTSHTISTLSDNGEYTAIKIDTTSTKTITFETTSTGYRAMINSIAFGIKKAGSTDCTHTNTTTETVAPTCTAAGKVIVKCECGHIVSETAGDAALGHIDSNDDYKCDRDCGEVVPPDADSVLTIEQALALGALYTKNNYTSNKYYITGTIVDVTNTTYGNMNIEDENGNKILVFGVYSENGSVRYDAMDVKPVAGDKITVYGIIGYYSAPQMKDSWMTEHIPAECDHVDANGDYVCDKDGCGVVVPPLADNVLTFEQADLLGSLTTTTGKYYLVGTIAEIVNTTYGNLYIKDAEGNLFYIYGLYSKDGNTRYDAMETKPVVGDKVTLYGIITSYNGNSQMKNAWLDDLIQHEHNYDSDVTTEPNCTEKGVETFTCTICGASYTEEIDALGHDILIDKAVVPGCESTGLTEGSHCSRCDGATVAQTVVDALGHDIVIDEAKAPTCTETGLTEGSHCTRCDGKTVAQTVIDAPGHKFIKGDCTRCDAIDLTYTVTVYFQNNWLWSDVSVYWWNGDTNNSWHGQSMTKVGNDGTYDIYSFQVPYKAEGMIINGIKNDGSGNRDQTPNITSGFNNCVIYSMTWDGGNKVLTGTYHAYTSEVLSAPDCESTGLTKHTCSVCGHSYEETTDKLGHDMITDAAKAPTCTETGLTEGSHCSRCDHKIAQETVDKLGHDIVIDEAKAPTCTETGLTEGSHCSRCDGATVAQAVVDALGHDIVIDEAKAPTCTETGLTEGSHCSRCDGATVAQETVDKLGHDIVIDEAKAPTCTETGLTEGSHCTRCDGATVAQETVDKLGHDMIIDEAKAPTCTETGLTEGSHCSRCDHKIAQETVDKLGHDIVIDEAKAPTCTETGLTEGSHCTRCDGATVAQTVVDALGHDMITDEAKAPTCTETGLTEGSHCSRCDHKIAQETVDALGHSFANGYCKTCGVPDPDFVPVVEIDGVKYDSLREAIDAAENGDTLILVADHSDSINVSGKSIKLDLAGKKLDSAIVVESGATLIISGNGYASGNITVNGTLKVESGIFNQDISGHLADGAECVAVIHAMAAFSRTGSAGAVYYVGNDVFESVVANANDGDTVIIESDITLSAGVAVNANITLDLNGKTISMEDSSGATAYAIKNNKALTIKDSVGNGKITFNSTTPSASNAYASNTISNYGTLTVESGTVENTTVGGACYAVDNYAGSTFTLNGGKLVAEKTTLRAFNWTNGDASKVSLNINGGEIISKDGYGINFNMGESPVAELNITGGTITTNDTDYNLAVYIINKGTAENLSVNVSGGSFNGYFALNGTTCTTMKKGAISVSGGSFEGIICYETPAHGFVSGGSFKTQLDPRACASGFACVETSDGTYGIVEAVASIDGIGYASLADALAAAQDGDTVLLLKDVTLDEALLIDKAITLDGDGHTLTSSATRAINVSCAGAVGIKNITIVGASDTERAINVIQKAATLTVDNVKAEGFKYTLNVAASSVGSNITVNNSTLSGYAAVNITGDNTVITINDSDLAGVNNAPIHESNRFAAIAIGDATTGVTTKNVKLTVNGGSITAQSSGNIQWILLVAESTGTYAYIDAELNLVVGAEEVFYGDVDEVEAYFRSAYKSYLAGRGFILDDAGNGMVGIGGRLNYYIGANGNWFFNGEDTGHKAVATDGTTPHIGENGNWWIGTTDTLVKAEASDGVTPHIGENGNWWIGNTDTGKSAKGTDGVTPHIGSNGNWFIGTTDTLVKAEGVIPHIGTNGNWFIGDGDTGIVAAGKDGTTPHIGTNGNWFIGEDDTGIAATGKDGEDGKTPHIGPNGNWWVGTEDLGVSAKGENGETPTFKIENGKLYAKFPSDADWTDLGPVVGTDGKTPEFKVENGELKVSYDDGASWTSLGNIAGANGQNGVNGKTPEFKVENGELKVSYDNGASWSSLGNIAGADGSDGNNGLNGKTPEFKVENGELKVSYDNGTSWTSLGNISGADGADGKIPEFKVENGELKVSYDDGASWTSLGNIAGQDGLNGKTPEFKVENGELKVSYDGGASWTGLGTIVGQDGINGKTPEFKVENGELKVSYDEGASWVSLGNIAGKDGEVPTISENGNWIIGGVETTYPAIGKDGKTPHIGENGNWYIGTTDTLVPAKGKDGKTPHIGENGNWFIGETDTLVPARGQDGRTPAFKIQEGHLFVSFDGERWEDLGNVTGESGKTPYVGENGNWWIGDEDTGVKATGTDGAAGTTPHIGENGNWFIGETDTGIRAQGTDGNDNNEIVLISMGIATLCLITTLVALATRKRRTRWWILS